MRSIGSLWCITLLLLLRQHATQEVIVQRFWIFVTIAKSLQFQQGGPVCLLQVQAPVPSSWGKAQPGDSQAESPDSGAGSGSVLIAGRVLQLEASCTDRGGQATVNMTVQDMPEGFATAAVTCRFVPWWFIEGTADAVDQARRCTCCLYC